jgi:hypothetical protein
MVGEAPAHNEATGRGAYASLIGAPPAFAWRRDRRRTSEKRDDLTPPVCRERSIVRSHEPSAPKPSQPVGTAARVASDAGISRLDALPLHTANAA